MAASESVLAAHRPRAGLWPSADLLEAIRFLPEVSCFIAASSEARPNSEDVSA
jgi:hypothetical protein